MKTAFAIAVLICAGMATFWSLPSSQSAHVLLSDATARPTGPGTAAAYVQITNSGAPDRLLSIDSPVADAALYSPAADAVPVPTGAGSLALDAAHIQLSNVPADMGHGALIPVTLNFEKAGAVTTKLRLSDPTQVGAAQQHGVFGIGDICVVGAGEPAPAITLSVSSVPDGYAVEIHTDEFEFSEDLAGLYHVPGVGHGHLYVGGMKLGRVYKNTALIGQLPTGNHELRVTLNTNDHRAYVVDDRPVTASAMILVD